MIYKAEHCTVSIDDVDILRDVSLTGQAGDLIGLVGPNGSGKSTWLQSLCGLLPLKSGCISIDETNITDVEGRELAHVVAYMQQQVAIQFTYSAYDIVMMGRYPQIHWWRQEGIEDTQIVKQAMEYVGVWHLRNKTIQHMSGGERQRVFLAKAIAQETEILLLDEPTAALDITHTHRLFQLCQQLCQKNKLIIVVVHDLELAAKYCSKLYLLAQGRVVAFGSPQQVLHSENLERVYGVKTDIFTDGYGEIRIHVI